LEYVPAKLEVHIYVRPKYACRYCKEGVVSPPPPLRPIARGIAGPGLIAQIVIAKFGDHLPLYRQEDFFTRHGLHVPRSTQCDWVRATAELLKPLYERQKELVLQSPVLWTDDTPVSMLVGGNDGSRTARFWTYIAEEHPYSVYDFTESRARDGPASFLQKFQGYLHADAYGGYDQIYLGSNEAILEVACWAHARRKFFDARYGSPRHANHVLEWIRQLYDIEDRARELSADARHELRATETIPVLNRIEAYLVCLSDRALPKSQLGKAVSYAQNQWRALRRFTEDGRLSIDNNVSERTLRHQAIGRKNCCSSAASKPGHERLSCSRSSRAPSVIGLNRGPICANCCCACTPTIRDPMKCCRTNGRPCIPRRCCTIVLKSPVAEQPLSATDDVTPDSLAAYANQGCTHALAGRLLYGVSVRRIRTCHRW
jgi:transposase